MSVEPTFFLFLLQQARNSTSACHLICVAGSPPPTDDPRKAGQGLFARPDRGKWQHWWREGSIYWKPNTSRPFGISFWYTDRAEYPVFMGKCQSRQMTWSLLQWRWSLLKERGAWRWIQEEQLGVSHRNKPAVCAQLCRELPFLNIHIFNRLKRLLRHTQAALRTYMCNRERKCYSGKAGSSGEVGQNFLQGKCLCSFCLYYSYFVTLC